MSYVPDIENAHRSVDYLQNEVAMGVIVRGMHHWGASVAIVMLFYIPCACFSQDLTNIRVNLTGLSEC